MTDISGIGKVKGELARKRVFSGVQPSGKLHIGNYAGALTLWTELLRDYDSIFCIVDLHAITLPDNIDPKRLRQKTREVAALYIACGIDPDQCCIFIQSHVKEHAELTWILNCVTPVGWLEGMHQYRTKSQQMESVGTGLLDYPVLQAADILLYDTALVPVGEDQRQHIEVTRDIAVRFNNIFGEVFVLPEAMIRTAGARIMGLDNPEAKMSKSLGAGSEGHSIGLLDPPDVARRAIMRAVTDSQTEVRLAAAGAGVRNLATIYQVFSGKSQEEAAAVLEGKRYGELKQLVAEVVIETLKPIQQRYADLVKDPGELEAILARGAEYARGLAQAKVKAVKELVGLG